MANVFTKKNGRPRTTTLSDFGYFNNFVDLPEPRNARVLSPTRRQNPHPDGLVSQKPYNRNHIMFDIWNPDFVKIAQRMPAMITHLEHKNFCCGQILPPLPLGGEPPQIHYTLDSISRQSYQNPPSIKEEFQNLERIGRFGNTPYKPARGIAPNTLPPIYTPPEDETITITRLPPAQMNHRINRR